MGERYIQVWASDNGHVHALSNKQEVEEQHSLASHYTLTTGYSSVDRYNKNWQWPASQ